MRITGSPKRHKYKGALARIRRWAKKRNITIKMLRSGETDYAEYQSTVEGEELIFCNSKMPLSKQVHYILHELGHASITDKEKQDRWTSWESEEEPKAEELLTEIDEEFEAWFRARLIASRIGIRLDLAEFNAHKMNALESYIISYVRGIPGR